MSHYYSIPLVNEAELAQAKAIMGVGLARILGYFREDGSKSITEIEKALAVLNAAAMVRPAHTLKGESRQFGAHRLAELAEVIEKSARRCVERREDPSEVITEIAMLRGCFAETLAILCEGTPLVVRAQPIAASPPSPPVVPPARPVPPPPGPRTFGRRVTN